MLNFHDHTGLKQVEKWLILDVKRPKHVATAFHIAERWAISILLMYQ